VVLHPVDGELGHFGEALVEGRGGGSGRGERDGDECVEGVGRVGGEVFELLQGEGRVGREGDEVAFFVAGEDSDGGWLEVKDARNIGGSGKEGELGVSGG
jgi:hypothetical protein